MFSLHYPPADFKIKQLENSRVIFDVIRRKYVVLTPEEWVRQNVLAYLCKVLGYPKTLISVEKEIRINNLKKRYDIVVYDSNHQPWMLIECKEPDTLINDAVLQQLLRYHNSLQCPYWMLTNGSRNFCAAVQEGKIAWLNSLPVHNEGILRTP